VATPTILERQEALAEEIEASGETNSAQLKNPFRRVADPTSLIAPAIAALPENH
jgi:hypothetical protein